MKLNSKYVYVFSALFVLAILISSASAAEKLVTNDFGNDDFAIDVPSGSDFLNETNTKINFGDITMNMNVFANHGDNANDVSTVVYLNDSSSKQDMINNAITDLKKEGVIVEETDKYFVVETKNANNWNFFNFDIGNDINNLFNFANGLFSSDSSIDVSGSDADVQVSSADGINIVDNENNTVKVSDKGVYVSDANGDDVSISTDGIKVSGSSSNDEGNASESVDVSADGALVSSLGNDDYAVVIQNKADGQLIVISGNNLDLLKSMAETASFA